MLYRKFYFFTQSIKFGEEGGGFEIDDRSQYKDQKKWHCVLLVPNFVVCILMGVIRRQPLVNTGQHPTVVTMVPRMWWRRHRWTHWNYKYPELQTPMSGVVGSFNHSSISLLQLLTIAASIGDIFMRRGTVICKFKRKISMTSFFICLFT